MVARESNRTRLCVCFFSFTLFYAMVYGKRQRGYTTKAACTLSRPAGFDGNWRAIRCSKNPHINSMGRPMMAKQEKHLCRRFYAAYTYFVVVKYLAVCIWLGVCFFFPSFLVGTVKNNERKGKMFRYIVCRYARVLKWRGNFALLKWKFFGSCKSGIQNQ